MKTFYVDAYFLINFTTDLVSLYFACKLFGQYPSRIRLCLCAGLLGMYSVLAVLWLPSGWIQGAGALVSAFVGVFLLSPRTGIRRQGVICCAFFICECLLGGLCYAGTQVLKQWIGSTNYGETGYKNSSALKIALFILCILLILRFLLSVFERNKSEERVMTELVFPCGSFRGEGLIDSGNLCRDPIDGTGVIVLRAAAVQSFLPMEFMTRGESDREELKKRMRIIPISVCGDCKILFGLRGVTVKMRIGKEERQSVATVAFDTKGERYGGTDCLIPSSIYDHVC